MFNWSEFQEPLCIKIYQASINETFERIVQLHFIKDTVETDGTLNGTMLYGTDETWCSCLGWTQFWWYAELSLWAAA